MGWTTLPAAVAFVALVTPGKGGDPQGPTVELKVVQKHLELLCLDRAPVRLGARTQRLGLQEHTLALTMRSDPRPGAPVSDATPGIAVIRFTPETGHKYDVEIRAAMTAYSWRRWKQGDWKPVVRDRSVDRVVSTEPEWMAAGCGS